MPRSRLISFVMGASESGKTVLVRKISAMARQPRLIIDPAGSWGDEGICVPDPWLPIARALKFGFEGTIILDDADAYLSASGHRDTWGRLWTQHRHFGVDVIAIFRRVQEIPRIAWSSCSKLFVFRTISGSPAEQYLRKNGYVPDGVPIPREPLKYLEADLFAERYLQRELTGADLKRYGNPRGC